ncbi:hypothetical protein GJAV_G00025380 [Gymnothorax javanicus]|nr:hypothetical protein GJAV_G00025380 [Gymnothorax javanicus]
MVLRKHNANNSCFPAAPDPETGMECNHTVRVLGRAGFPGPAKCTTRWRWPYNFELQGKARWCCELRSPQALQLPDTVHRCMSERCTSLLYYLAKIALVLSPAAGQCHRSGPAAGGRGGQTWISCVLLKCCSNKDYLFSVFVEATPLECGGREKE